MPEAKHELELSRAEVEALEMQARQRWESADLQRTKKDVLEKDFPDEWLEEIESEATE